MNETTHTDREIDKFNQLADEFWDKEGNFKTLHQINPIRINFIQEFIQLHGKNIIDVGCGGGILSEALAELGAKVNAIDLSSVGIKSAKQQQLISHSDVNYQQVSTTDFLAQNTQKSDAVFCMEMLEHVENPAQIIADCSDMVADDGIVIFSTINRNRKSQLLGIIVAEYIMNMVPKGTHDYQLFIKPSEMVKMAKSVGLEPIDIMGFEYRPLQKDFVRSNNVDINYIFAFKKNSK